MSVASDLAITPLVEQALDVLADATRDCGDAGARTRAHSIEVAQLVSAAGFSPTVVAAAVLHDVLEDTPMSAGDLRARIGDRVADLAGALTENPAIASYPLRKAALRGQVAESGSEAAAIAVADKLARVRELRASGEPLDPSKVHHYRETLRILSERHPGLPLLEELSAELDGLHADADTKERTLLEPHAAALRDGSTVLLRPIARSDARLLAEAYERLSEESRRRRFLAAPSRLSDEDLRYLTDVDGYRHAALVALDPSTGELVGEARFVREPGHRDTAEVAALVVDDRQGRGIGTALLTELTRLARERGLSRYKAIVAADNHQVLDALTRIAGDPVQAGDGQLELEFDLPSEGPSEGLLATLGWAAQGQLRLLGAIARRAARISPRTPAG
jgi:RimJ/RimL family protein N-acetyltransferase